MMWKAKLTAIWWTITSRDGLIYMDTNRQVAYFHEEDGLTYQDQLDLAQEKLTEMLVETGQIGRRK